MIWQDTTYSSKAYVRKSTLYIQREENNWVGRVDGEVVSQIMFDSSNTDKERRRLECKKDVVAAAITIFLGAVNDLSKELRKL